MAKTLIQILFTWALLQAVCDTADVCYKPRDSAVNVVRKVAFSASMTDTVVVDFEGVWGEKELVFKTVDFNIGDAYDPTTGIFKAPVKGAYQFTYSTWCHTNSTELYGARLAKNGITKIQISTRHAKGVEYPGSTSAALILSLEAGDKVNVATWGHDRLVYDGPKFLLNTFSGYLIYPLEMF